MKNTNPQNTFSPEPGAIENARNLVFEPSLDAGISDAVYILIANGVETFESCEGGRGHSYPCPTVRFEGSTAEGLRALSVAMSFGLPVSELRRVWEIRDGVIHGPWWEMTFIPPRDSQQWADRDTTGRYEAARQQR